MLAAAAVTLLAFRDGGYFPSAWRAATVALLATAVLAIVLRRASAPSRAQLVVVLALGALAGWTALSALWSPDPGTSLLEAQRTLVYVAAVAAAFVVGGRVFAGTLAAIALVCTYSVGQRLLEGPPDPPLPSRERSCRSRWATRTPLAGWLRSASPPASSWCASLACGCSRRPSAVSSPSLSR